MAGEIVIERRFRGPARSANGGYMCGLAAELVDGDAVEVTLRLPPPLETPLAVVREGAAVRVLAGDAVVAEGRPMQLELDPPSPPPPFAEVERLAGSLGDDPEHPFPGCFVCGPGREEGDGLRLRPVPLGDGRVAAAWRVQAELARPQFVWASLDCPGGWAVTPDFSRGISVLGRLAARLDGVPRPGDECVVVGWPLEADGRKLHAGTALFRNGEVLALARAVWLQVPPERRDQ